jgi:hypothetical protein
MPVKHLQIIEHPQGEILVRPPDIHVDRREKETVLQFDNHLEDEVVVTLNPLVRPDPPALPIAPGRSDRSTVSPQMSGTYPYQIYVGPRMGGRKAKGLCDPIIIVYPPGHN